MLALSFKAYSAHSARLLLYMTAEDFICLHSLCRSGSIFTGGLLRLYLVFPDWQEVSVACTTWLSSYPLLFSTNSCISLIICVCCLLLIEKAFPECFFYFAGHMKSCFWGLSSPFLCLIPLFSSSWFLPVQTFLFFLPDFNGWTGHWLSILEIILLFVSGKHRLMWKPHGVM